MKSYHFDCGNSNEGPVGFCARIRAENEEEALAILCELIPETLEFDLDDDRVEYFQVYTNTGNVTVSDMDPSMVEDVEEDE